MNRRNAIRFRIYRGDDPLREEVFPLDAHRVIKIGRLKSSQIQIDDATVARMHAVIETHGDDLVIIDLGSTTGTVVNGKPANKAVLQSGDEIMLGSVRLIVNFVDVDYAVKTSPPPPSPSLPLTDAVLPPPPPADLAQTELSSEKKSPPSWFWSVIGRVVLTLIFGILVYRETGWWTAMAMALIALAIELQSLQRQLERERMLDTIEKMATHLSSNSPKQ